MGEKTMAKTVLITGAASEIGQEILSVFLNRNYKIIATEISSEMASLKEMIKHEEGRVKTFVLDLEKDEDITSFTKSVLANYPIHDLVNVAGINILRNFFEWTAEDLRKVMNINWVGTFLLSKAVAENMILHSIKGSITTISSQHAVAANKERVPYCVSKAGLVQLTKVLGLELAPYKIRANCVSPTFVLTEKNKHLLYSSQFLDQELTKIPLGSYAEPRDIAGAVEFLSSDSSSMITGHNLIVDGGWTIQ